MKINIIGAGITGLSVAYFFARMNHKVRIFEQAADVGGLASSFLVNGAYLEKYYHHSFAGHTELIKLMGELDIKDKFISSNVKTGFYFNGEIHPFGSVSDLLQFKPLKMIDRIRLGLTSLLMMKITDWHKLENKSAMEWLNRYSGSEACRVIWEPLLKMKFGEDYDKISSAWLWNRVVDRRKKGGNKEVFGYVKEGYQTLLNALIKYIKTMNGDIFTNIRVDKIDIDNGKCTGVSVNGKRFDSDIVLSTIPIPSFLSITKGLPKEYVNALSSIRYQHSVCVVLKLKRALSEYYWINVSDPTSPFIGIIEHTNFIPPEYYGDNHLVYLTKYTSSDSEIFHMPDNKVYDIFISYLEKIFQGFKRHEVEQYWVFKDSFSQPIFVKNYSNIMPKFDTPIKNLYLLNTTQMYPLSRSLNSSIALAREMEKKITSEKVSWYE